MGGVVADWFGWWYGAGFRRAGLVVQATVHNTLDQFSVKLLLPHLFAPWKRDVLSMQGLSLQERLQVIIMNLVSRLVGAVVRLSIVIGGLLAALVEAILGGLYLTLWLLWPILVPLLLLLAVVIATLRLSS